MPIFKQNTINETTVTDISTYDEIMNFNISQPIRLNENRIVKEMLECYNGNISILENESEQEVNNFETLKSKFKEYVSTKDLEKEYLTHLNSRTSALLRFSFLSRAASKNPNLKNSELKEISKMNAKVKGDICKIYELGAEPEQIAKLKKALINLDITDKYINDKETVSYTYTIDTDDIEIEETHLLANSTPYYTIEEIRSKKVLTEESLDLSETVKYKDWLECVDMLSKGIVHVDYQTYYPLWVNKVQKLMENVTDNKNSIISLGWNPDLSFTLENRILGSKRFTSLVNKFNNILDISNMSNTMYTNESVLSNTKSPVYVIVTYTKTLFGKITRAVTDGMYTHAGFSFSNNLDKIYSYNVAVNGFSIENLKSYNHDDGCIMALYTILVDNAQLKKMKNYIDLQIGTIKDSKYSIPTLFGVLLNKPIHLDNGMICSQFVDTVFKNIGIDITKKDSALVTPQDFRNTKQKFFVKVYEGPIKEYKPSSVETKVSKLMTANFKSIKEEYIEEKELPIRFDKDGNMLIDNMKNLDYESEYAKCHSMLVTYEKSNNTESMKYELCKLWFMNSLIQDEIYNKKPTAKRKEELHKARAKIMNDFVKYNKIIAEKEDFNFTDYYNKSQFSDVLKIDKHTMSHGANLVKGIAKTLLV